MVSRSWSRFHNRAWDAFSDNCLDLWPFAAMATSGGLQQVRNWHTDRHWQPRNGSKRGNALPRVPERTLKELARPRGRFPSFPERFRGVFGAD